MLQKPYHKMKKERTKARKKEKTKISIKLLQVPVLKISTEGGGNFKKKWKCERKRKQAFYNFEEKEAVEWTAENIYSGN